jgi:hypothetical protein
MRLVLLLASMFASFSIFAKDLTTDYDLNFKKTTPLKNSEIQYLRERQIIIVPGILAEVFNREDTRGEVDFSRITKDYFANVVTHLKFTLQIPVQKIFSSSKTVKDTTILVAEALNKVRAQNKKALLIVHSLGGLALLDHLLQSDEAEWDYIEGIIWLQVPFYGSPIADIYLSNPFEIDRWITPLLPFFHTSLETITYLSVAHRTKFMEVNLPRIKEILIKIPSYTMSGVTNGTKSVFKPAADIMEHGCLLNVHARCLSPKLWQGPYSLSDGMVPLFSTKLPFIDFMVIRDLDHGEPIVNLPFQNVSKEAMTEAMIKVILDKIKTTQHQFAPSPFAAVQ